MGCLAVPGPKTSTNSGRQHEHELHGSLRSIAWNCLTAFILTTTYTGATEIQALDELAGLPGCRIRISLDGRRTRLHAKAWLFQRRTGFGSAYVGSANLSGAALMGGLEWTVKFTERGQADLFERAKAHFETLWEDNEFQVYDPKNPLHRVALGEALKRESGEDIVARPTFFDLEPKTYQQEFSVLRGE